MMKFLVTVIFAFFAVWAYARYAERRILFVPSRSLTRTPADAGMEFEDIFFSTVDGVRLNGWFIKAAGKTPAPATVLYFHGNAGNIAGRIDKVSYLQQMGLNVFLVDYRGYGKSEGAPTEQGLSLDAWAAYDYLVGVKGVPAKKVVVYGSSLGGAAAVDLACRRPVAALILDSTFTSAADMARKIIPLIPSFMVSVKLDSVHKIATVTAPKLFIHSSTDEVVPFALGQRLFAAAPFPKEFLEIRGGHNDGYLVSEKTYVGGIKAFLRKYELLED